MFTGLIEKKARVLAKQTHDNWHRLIVAAAFDEVQPGESIAVNGVCLTALPAANNELHFDLSPETLKVTTLANLAVGDYVNLERAMIAATRFGGHYVSGHVDTKATITMINGIDGYIAMDLSGFKDEAMLYLIPKGSITVEGVSLTINSVSNKSIQLMLIPHTLLLTTLGTLQIGQQVNIEFDYLTRIVAHQLRIVGKLDSEVQS